jgi:hypothetical protein
MTTDEKLAWTVTVSGMDCVVFATTSAKARWIAVRSYWDAGYGNHGQWPNCRAKRYPILDKSPLRDKPQRAWVPEYATTYP